MATVQAFTLHVGDIICPDPGMPPCRITALRLQETSGFGGLEWVSADLRPFGPLPRHIAEALMPDGSGLAFTFPASAGVEMVRRFDGFIGLHDADGGTHRAPTAALDRAMSAGAGFMPYIGYAPGEVIADLEDALVQASTSEERARVSGMLVLAKRLAADEWGA